MKVRAHRRPWAPLKQQMRSRITGMTNENNEAVDQNANISGDFAGYTLGEEFPGSK